MPLSHISDVPFDLHSMLDNSIPSNNKVLPSNFDSTPLWVKCVLVIICIIIALIIVLFVYLYFARNLIKKLKVRKRKRADYTISVNDSSQNRPEGIARDNHEEAVLFINDTINEPTIRFERPPQ